MSNKKPEELSRNALLRLAIVVEEIQDQIHNSLTNSNEVHIQPDTINDYFRLITCEDGDGWDDENTLSENDVRLEQLRKIKIEGLDYLRSDGMIKIGYMGDDDVSGITSLTFIDYDMSNFKIKVSLKEFSSFYKAFTKISRPILEAELKQHYPYSSQDDKQPTSHTTGTAICEVSLRLKGKTLRLFINDTPSVVVKKFKSKNANNIRAYFELQRCRGTYLTKEDMKIHLRKAKSNVKDIPKTMGITGLLADYFIDIDSKRQMLRIPKQILIPQEELEILLDYVKRISEKK